MLAVTPTQHLIVGQSDGVSESGFDARALDSETSWEEGSYERNIGDVGGDLK
jgi:hypothetical protein